MCILGGQGTGMEMCLFGDKGYASQPSHPRTYPGGGDGNTLNPKPLTLNPKP